MSRWARIIVWTVSLACGLVALRPSDASAQTANFGSQKAWVTTVDGREQQGRLTSFTPSGVVLRLPDGQLATLPMRDVLRVEVKDGLGNGACNGAVGGLLMSAMFVASITSLCDGDCSGIGPFVVTGIVAYTAMGTGIGVAIDAMRGKRQSIYSASSATSIAIAPMVTRRSAGVNVAVRWPNRR
jgi:hypothetical protein